MSAEADADLWWHLLAGDQMIAQGALVHADPWTFTVPGAPWVDHEWLPELATSVAWGAAGALGLLGLRAAWLLVLMCAWLDTVSRRVGGLSAAVALVVLPWPLLSLLANLRPQTVTWALVPVVIALADRTRAGKRWATWALVLLVWAWANTHGGFLFGWGLGGLALLLRARSERSIGSLIAVGLLAVSPAFTPYGMELVHYVVREITSAHPDLPEWNPPAGLMVVVLALFGSVPPLLWAAVRMPLRLASPVPWVGFGVAVFAAIAGAKFVALVMILGPICAAEPLAFWLGREERSELRGVMSRVPFLVGVVLTAVLVQVPFVKGPPGSIPVNGKRYPVQAVSFLKAAGGQGRLATPLGWGGIALYHLFPDYRVSMDGRNTTVFSVEMVDEQGRAWRDGDAAVVLGLDCDAALVPVGKAMDLALRREGWIAAFEGESGAVLTPPGKPVLRAPGFSPPVAPLRFP